VEASISKILKARLAAVLLGVWAIIFDLIAFSLWRASRSRRLCWFVSNRAANTAWRREEAEPHIFSFANGPCDRSGWFGPPK